MLVIQDPTNEQSTYLLESLLEAFRSAEKVAGAFAYVSSAGVRLFTQDEVFQNVAGKHSVDLVVGIDGVTNERALDSLTAVGRAYSKVRIRAFLNPRPEALFHPKFCWTRERNGGHLITGSGNLTEAGLLGNWEAYSVEKLSASGITAVERAWDNWTSAHAASLLPLDNPEVRRLASENNILAREGDLPTLVAPAIRRAPDDESTSTQIVPAAASVLVAEIPKNRPGQANFHLDDYVNFFGAREGLRRLILFRHVNADGTLDEFERSRPPVVVASRNFRFELAATSGRPYPVHGRPIGVFVRMATRYFFYRFTFPNEPEFRSVNGLLDRRVGPARPKKMRSARMTAVELRAEWPTAPFWQLPSTA